LLISQVAAQPDVKFISVDEVPADLKEKAAHQGQSKLALSKMQRTQSCWIECVAEIEPEWSKQ